MRSLLLRDSGLSPRRQGVRQVAAGLALLLGWLALFAGFAYLSQDRPPPGAGDGWEKVPLVGGAFLQVCGTIVLLLFLPAGWGVVILLVGLFQVVTGVRFGRVNAWWEDAPVWGKLLAVPVVVAVWLPLTFGLVLAVLAPVIWVYQSLTR